MLGEASSSKLYPSDPSSFIPHITSLLDGLTTSASTLPPKSDLAFHRTLDRQLGKDLDSCSERVLRLAEQLLAHADLSGVGKKEGKRRLGGGKGRRQLADEEDVTEGYRRTVGEVVDGLLEDADSCLDEVNGQKRKAAIAVPPELAKHAGDKLPGPISQPSSTSSKNNYNLMATPDDFPKSQLLFSDAVDNSDTRPPWVPTITTKLHGTAPIKAGLPEPLPLSAEEMADPLGRKSREDRERRKARHPYYLETRQLEHPSAIFQRVTPRPPKSYEETPFAMIETPEQLAEMVQHLQGVTEIAVDLEHHDYRSYYGFTCLIQISTRARDFIVDPLKLRDELREGKLGGVMVNPNIIKVMHGANSDIVWLQKDFEIYVVNLFDTYHASHALELQQHSLKSLLLKYCDFHADKRYQMADWRIRPLPTEMMHYARSDTHFLLYIYDRLREELFRRDPTSREGPIRTVLKHSADVSLRLYERETYEGDTGKGTNGWLAAGKKWLRGALDEEAGLVWKRLHIWRDAVARKEDENWAYVMSQEALKNLATRLPTTTNAVKTIVRPNSRVAWRRPLEVLKVINDARAEWIESGKVSVLAGLTPLPSTLASPTLPPTPLPTSPLPHATSTNKHAPGAASPLVASTQVADPPVDLWASFGPSTNSSSSRSALFGDALGSTAGPASPDAGSRSALFGTALSTSVRSAASGRQQISDFAQVTARINAGIVGATRIVPPGHSGTIEDSDTVSAASKPNTTDGPSGFTEMPVESDPSAGADSVPVPVTPSVVDGKDTIVQVKRSKKKRARETTNGAAVASSDKKQRVSVDEVDASISAAPSVGSSGGAEAVTAGSKKKKGKKARPQPEDIPVFDYASQPNLLDNPESASPSETKKGKNARRKEKKRQMQAMQGSNAQTGAPVITDTKFGEVSRGKSERKEGNRSMTFPTFVICACGGCAGRANCV